MGKRLSLTLKTLPYSIVYGTSVYCGMRALSLVNIPMFLALRKTLIFFVFVVGLFIG
jgi:solute carrier family 35 protein